MRGKSARGARLTSRAEDKGVTLLGECGLDPGIDSMYVTDASFLCSS